VAVRREVYRRDGARCAYVDARGQRCKETHYLELHHLQPFARNGAHLASNLTLRCVAHNALAADRDFGPELMTERRRSPKHEALASHTRVRKRRPE
jgi:5-methylcytosine-specific restriction endonuclease McrA